MSAELQDALLAADSFREERDEARAELKKAIERVDQLTKELADKKAAPKQKKSSKGESWSAGRMARTRQLASDLNTSFIWSSTARGSDYWTDVFIALCDLGDGEGWREDR